MTRDRLKPYVYKVEGAVNFTLFNMLNGQFYQFSTEGSITELRKLLLEEGLIYQTDGIIPSEVVKPDTWEMQNHIYLRKILIRLNGNQEDNCWNRQKSEENNAHHLKPEALERLIEECTDIPIQHISIEAETENFSLIKTIVNRFNCRNFQVYIRSGLTPLQKSMYDSLCSSKNVQFLADGKKNITEYQVEMVHFFYTQTFNACLGHQIALDADGSIKPCLWSKETLGNIMVDDLREMIIRGQFDKYWYAAKEKIASCKDCEFQNVCQDCRISALEESHNINAKPTYCHYNPYTGSTI